MANKCLDVAGSGTADGSQIQLWTCDGTPLRIWDCTGNADQRRAL